MLRTILGFYIPTMKPIGPQFLMNTFSLNCSHFKSVLSFTVPENTIDHNMNNFEIRSQITLMSDGHLLNNYIFIYSNYWQLFTNSIKLMQAKNLYYRENPIECSQHLKVKYTFCVRPKHNSVEHKALLL